MKRKEEAMKKYIASFLAICILQHHLLPEQ
jgi:hypothetical protein